MRFVDIDGIAQWSQEMTPASIDFFPRERAEELRAEFETAVRRLRGELH